MGHSSAFQIWDCKDLEALREIFKCDTTHKTQEKSLGWSGCVFGAAVIPKSRRKGGTDPFRADRLPIGIF